MLSKKFWIVCLSSAILMLALSCAGQPDVLRIGIIKPSVDHLPLSYALSQGWLNEKQVKVFSFTSGWEVNEALNAGKLDLAIMPFSYAWTSAAKGGNVKILSCLERETDGIISSKGITKLTDLQGKKIGLLRASTLEVLMRDTARHEKIDFNPVYFRTPAEMLAALKTGDIEAAVCYVPLIQKLDKEYHVVFWFSERYPNHPCCDLAVNTTALANRKKAIRSVRTALVKASIQFANPDDRIYQFVMDNYKLTREQAVNSLNHTSFEPKLTDADRIFERSMMESFRDESYLKDLPSPSQVYVEQ